MLETTIENRLKKEVEKRGGMCLKFTSPGMRGVPDRIVLVPAIHEVRDSYISNRVAKVIFVELKKPGEIRRPLQIKRALELHELGFEVHCLDSHRAVDRFFVEVFGK